MVAMRAEATSLETIAAAIDRLCDINRDLRATSPTSFDSVEAPGMTVHSYLVRIRRYTRFDDMCFLIALTYLGRLAEMGGPSFCLTYHNVHRLFVTALVLASKSSDDIFHANSFMAQCGGISLFELNNLEVEMCKWLTFRLIVDTEELQHLVCALGDHSSAFWDSWRNVPVAPAMSPQTFTRVNHGLARNAAAIAATRATPSSKQRYDSVNTTMGEMAALLWPAPTERDGQFADGQRTIYSHLQKQPQYPESPRTIAWIDVEQQRSAEHNMALQMEAQRRQLHELGVQMQEQACQQPHWGMITGMEVR